MSKNCFLLAPLIKFNLLTQTINLCQRFKKRLRHLTVVEVEVFSHVSIHVRLLGDIMSKNCFLLAPLIQLQSADSNNQRMPTFSVKNASDI